MFCTARRADLSFYFIPCDGQHELPRGPRNIEFFSSPRVGVLAGVLALLPVECPARITDRRTLFRLLLRGVPVRPQTRTDVRKPVLVDVLFRGK